MLHRISYILSCLALAWVPISYLLGLPVLIVLLPLFIVALVFVTITTIAIYVMIKNGSGVQ